MRKEKTIGEQRVRVDFNVGSDSLVTGLRSLTALLITACDEIKEKDPRLAALAMTAYEEAGMWAVKLATTE